MQNQTKIRGAKTRANNTMTEAAFFTMIRSALRQKSRWWLPVQLAKKDARRAYIGTNKRIKWEYKCTKCKNWFFEKEIEVNHKIPAGSLSSFEDLHGFVERLFCEKEDLEVVCKECHKIETSKQKLAKSK